MFIIEFDLLKFLQIHGNVVLHRFLHVMNWWLQNSFNVFHVTVHFLSESFKRYHSVSPQLFKFNLCLVPHLFHFLNQGQVIQGVNVVIKTVGKLLLVGWKIVADLFAIDEQCQWNNCDANDYGWQAVTPNVYALIVDHEETLEDFFWSVEVDSVSMGNVLIIFHIPRGSVVVTDSCWGFGFTNDCCLHLIFRFVLTRFCWHRIQFLFF